MRMRIVTLFMLAATALFSMEALAQDKVSKERRIGFSFTVLDFVTPKRISDGSLSNVLTNEKWAKLKEAEVGISLFYSEKFAPGVDFMVGVGGAFVSDANQNSDGNDDFLLTTDATFQLNAFSDKYFVQPHVIVGFGASLVAGSRLGAYFPVGVGLNFNVLGDTKLFLKSTYRIPVTNEAINKQFVHQLGMLAPINW